MAVHRRAEVRGVVTLVVSYRATERSLEHLQCITVREPAKLDLAGGAEHDRRARQKREGASRQRIGKLGGDVLGRSREVVEHDHGAQRAEFALDHRLRRAPGRPARPERAVDVELEVVEVGIGRADTHGPVRQRRCVVRECMPPDVGLADPLRPAEDGHRVGGQQRARLRVAIHMIRSRSCPEDGNEPRQRRKRPGPRALECRLQRGHEVTGALAIDVHHEIDGVRAGRQHAADHPIGGDRGLALRPDAGRRIAHDPTVQNGGRTGRAAHSSRCERFLRTREGHVRRSRAQTRLPSRSGRCTVVDCGRLRLRRTVGEREDGSVAGACRGRPVVAGRVDVMTRRDARRRELGLVASYLRELRQQTRAAAAAAVRDLPAKPREPRRRHRVSPPAAR